MPELTENTTRTIVKQDRRETVLIIEDDPGIAHLESLHLRRAGYVVVTVTSATAGLSTVRGGGIDLIILDQNHQGGESGLDFYEELRSTGNQTPAILVTGLNDESTMIRAVRSGLSDFVPKTTDYYSDLTRAVERVLAQVRTQRRLVESEERLAGVTLLAQAVPSLVWTARIDGYFDFCNLRWYEFTGLTREQTEGWNWCRVLHPEDLDRVSSLWTRSLTTGESFETEYRLRRGDDGAFRWFLSRGELVRDGTGQVVKWFGTCTDIDDQKRAQQELKQANEIAESASRAKDQFLAMLSHELRTPLNPAILAAAAAKDDPTTPPHLRETFEEIRQNLELEARLIDDLLDVMRIIRGKLPYNFEVVDAHRLIDKVIEICRADAEARTLELVVIKEATDHHVNADSARLQQVLWNLIKNAIKFTPATGLVSIRTTSEDGHFVVEVTDTGIGIDPAYLPSIFNAFEQGEDIITKRYGGLGLGLAISKSVVEGHDGSLIAESAGRDQGAKFTLKLPTEIPLIVEDQPINALISSRNEITGQRILFVEDDVMTSRIMAKLLRQNGYVVTTANSVAQALEVRFEDYDLVVSDLGLPDGSGLEMMKTIRMNHNVPGIALTGFGMEDDIRKSREAGFVAHLIKPLDFSKLNIVLRKICSEQDFSSSS